MATNIWGLLKESLISSKLIREAIADMIADHDNDPTAHLGETGSLLSHKASEIIDHEAASILLDKMARKFTVNTNFASLDGCGKYHGGTGYIQNSFPGMSLAGTALGTGWAQIICDNSWGGNFSADQDCQYKSVNFLFNQANGLARFGIGVTRVADGPSGFYFEINAGVIHCGAINDPDTILSASLGSLASGWHCFEILYTASTNTALFLIDGILVYTLVQTFDDPEPGIMMTFYLETGTAYPSQFFCYNAQFQLDI